MSEFPRLPGDNRRSWLLAAATTLILATAVQAPAQGPARSDPRPGNLRAIARIDSLLADSRADEAAAAARRLLSEKFLDDDLRWQAEQRLGVAEHRLGRLEEALDHLERATMWAPAVAANHSNLAAVLIDMGRPGRAMGELRTASELAPRDWRLQLDYADILVEFKQYDKARRVLRGAGEFCPGCLEVDQGWARLLVAEGDLVGAAPYLERVYAAQPDRRLRLLLAEALLQSGEPERARSLLGPDWPGGLDSAELAVVLRADSRLGDSERAASLIVGLREGKPAPLGADLWALASMICAEDGREGDSLVLIERAIEMDPRNAVFRNNRVSLLYRLGRDDEADREWEIVIEIDPSLAGNRFEISE